MEFGTPGKIVFTSKEPTSFEWLELLKQILSYQNSRRDDLVNIWIEMYRDWRERTSPHET